MRKPDPIVAGVDLGSNSFRLLIGRVAGDGKISPLARSLATVRLAKGLRQHGRLPREAVAAGLAALARFRRLLAHHRPAFFRACGTHALRRAENAAAFLAQAEERLARPVEIISPAAEVQLAIAGAASQLGLSGPLLLIDVGGGSSELGFAGRGQRLDRWCSIELGAVSLTELAGDASGPAMAGILAERTGAATAFLASLPPTARATVVATGGTASGLAALSLGLDRYQPERLHGLVIDRQRLSALIDRLRALSPGQRDTLPGLDPGRGRILLAGACLLQELLAATGACRLLISEAGLLEGILLRGRFPSATTESRPA